MEHHDINLNIHYTMPDDLWKKLSEVYASMPYWVEEEKSPCWRAENIDLMASVEPSGIQIFGEMPEEIWEIWYSEQNRCAMACQGCDAVFLFLNKKAVETKS